MTASEISLEIFDALPPGHLAFTVPDHSCEPLIHRGETAIIDVADHEPEDGALFLRKVGSAEFRSTCYRIEETFQLERNLFIDGKVERQPAWFLGAHHRPRGTAEIEAWLRAGKPGVFVDGPYVHYGKNAWVVRDQLVGRVIGILSRPASPACKAVPEACSANFASLGYPDTQIAADRPLRPSYLASRACLGSPEADSRT